MTTLIPPFIILLSIFPPLSLSLPVVQDCVRLGNLHSTRDWGHARDYVECMWLMLQQETPEVCPRVVLLGVCLHALPHTGAHARKSARVRGSAVRKRVKIQQCNTHCAYTLRISK